MSTAESQKLLGLWKTYERRIIITSVNPMHKQLIAFPLFLTFSGDGVADGRSTRHSSSWLHPHHRCGLTLFFSPLAETKTAVLCSAQAIYLP